MTALETAAIAVLKAIVAEVAGPEQPFSADSYLPAHLIHDARAVIDQADHQQITAAGSDIGELRNLCGSGI